jgi:hypothetical protein
LFLRFALPCAVSLELTGKKAPNERGFLMRQLQLIAHGEPSDVIELNTVFEPVLGQEEVLVSMEATPLNPFDFTLVRGIYGVRPALPFSMGSEGVGRVVKTGSKVDVAQRRLRAGGLCSAKAGRKRAIPRGAWHSLEMSSAAFRLALLVMAPMVPRRWLANPSRMSSAS